MILQREHINTLFTLLIACVLVGVFRSYVFTDIAAVAVLFLFLFAVSLHAIKTRTFKLFLHAPFYLQYIFILYLYIRIDINISGNYEIVKEQVLYLFIFTITTIFSYNKFSNLIITIPALAYLLVFSGKVLLIFSQIRNGGNLWSGYVIFLLVALISMHEYTKFKKLNLIALYSPPIYFIFLIMVTSRVAAISVLLFFSLTIILPKIKNFMRSILFISVITLLIMFVLIYSGMENNGIWSDMNSFSKIIFNKSIFSGRHYIWKDLIDLIQVNPIFGYCSNCASVLFDATNHFRNLSSHNTFLEILLRGGIVGLVMFLAILFSIWRVLFLYRHDQQVNVSASFLLASLVFMSSAELWFANVLMCNVIAWIMLGLGYGRACNISETSYFIYDHKNSK